MSTLMFAKMAADRAASEDAAQQAQQAAKAPRIRQRLPPLGADGLPLAAAGLPAEDAPQPNKTDEEAAKSKSQGIGQLVEALSGMIPTEVLTLHALTLTVTTTVISPGSPAHDKIMEVISPAASGTATAAAKAATTVASKSTEAAASIATITAPGTLKAAFWALIVLSLLLYLVPRGYDAWKAAKPPVSGWYWYRQLRFLDWVCAAIPPLSFVAWTMLQRTTAFDAAFPHVAEANRTVFGLFLAVVLLTVSGWVAFKPIPSNNLPNQGGGGAANDDIDPTDGQSAGQDAGDDAQHDEVPTGAATPNG